MTKPINLLELEGKRYALVPLEVLEQHAPQLVPGRTPSAPYIPWEVARRTLGQSGVTLLKAWREHLGVPQEELAKRLGISQPALSKMESSRTLRKVTREKIAKAMSISPEQLA